MGEDLGADGDRFATACFADNYPCSSVRTLIRLATTQWSEPSRDKLFSLSDWAEDGFCTLISSSGKFSASLMCSSSSGLDISAIYLPASMVLFECNEELCGYSYVLAKLKKTTTDALPYLLAWNAKTSNAIMIMTYEVEEGAAGFPGHDDPLKALLFEEMFAFEGHDTVQIKSKTMRPPSDGEVRAAIMLRNFCAGMLIAYQDKNRSPMARCLARGYAKRHGAPNHRVAFLGKPVRCDTQSYVKEYVSGIIKRVPSVQWVVRGHYRNQVCGKGRTSRKIIWIEPYWKGPEEAPILVGAKAVG